MIERWELLRGRSRRVLMTFAVMTGFLVIPKPSAFGHDAPVPHATQTASIEKSALSEAPLGFEVATVKPAAPSPDGHVHINYPPGGGFSAINITVLALMEWAYSMPARQILDGPPWLDAARFDIQAKADPATDIRLRNLSSNEGQEAKRRMVQALLAERYGLLLHAETRVLPAYDLILARGGSKLVPSIGNNHAVGLGRTHLQGENLTVAALAEQLSLLTGRIVVDKTSLPGHYDVKLQWSSDDGVPTEDSSPTLFVALQEQLGLKLQAVKQPVPVLVIDRIAQPSVN